MNPDLTQIVRSSVASVVMLGLACALFLAVGRAEQICTAALLKFALAVGLSWGARHFALQAVALVQRRLLERASLAMLPAPIQAPYRDDTRFLRGEVEA